jgi:hypothetical protein
MSRYDDKDGIIFFALSNVFMTYSKLIDIIYKYVICMEYFWVWMYVSHILFSHFTSFLPDNFCKTPDDYRCTSK